jgi:hypothetical protein
MYKYNKIINKLKEIAKSFPRKVTAFIISVTICLLGVLYVYFINASQPKIVDITLSGQKYQLSMPIIHEGVSDCPIEFNIKDQNITARLFFREYPLDNEYVSIPFVRNGYQLTTLLPNQEPQEKLAYYVEFTTDDGNILYAGKKQPYIIHFKGEIPIWIYYSHRILYALALFFALWVGLRALYNVPNNKRIIRICLYNLLLGMIIGVMEQHFAYLQYWNGISCWNSELDNKAFISFCLWLTTYVCSFKTEKKYLIITTSFITAILIFIPLSV